VSEPMAATRPICLGQRVLIAQHAWGIFFGY
jgi:hypothetical protein